MSKGSVEVAGHRIEIDCPHVEDGACSACMWPQIAPYVAARQTLDDLLPKLAMLTDALDAHAKHAQDIAKGTAKLREWVELAASAKWKLTDEGAK